MANSTKTTYKPAKKGNYKSVVRMAEGGNVSELDYSERREYIEENYAPFITDAQMIFSIYDSGIEYDYKGDRKQVTQSIIEQYKSLADYTESTLPQETIYEIQDWDLVRKEIDPDTDEVIGETPLEQISSDNTYNFSYNGLVDLNWRVYHDEEYDRFFYVITPHLGGDIRGNYGDAIILEGNDKEELFYRFYEGFISGGASIYIKFKDGSEIGFDSEQDSDVFYFRVNEVFEPTGMAQKYLNDFEKFDSWKADEFLEETIDIYLARNGVVPMMMAGGSLNDENPMAYIQILGYDEGKYFNLTDYADGQDVINGIYEWMNGLNEQFGGNREEYEVTDYEGFGDDLYDAYMGENEFDEIIEAYEKYQSSDFPADVISAYKNDSGSRNDSLSDVIDEMDNNYFGKYENLEDFGYEMVQQGVYEPSENDVYITDTDKRIIAGEEADSKVDDMRFEDLMDVALDTQSDYENEKSELEDKISEIQSEIDDLTDLQSSVDDDDEYETIAEQIEEKEVELDDVQNELDNIDSRFEDEAREEAIELFYYEIYNKLEKDLDGWLSEMGYDTSNLADVSFLSIDYEKIGDELSSDYLIVEFDGSMYFFNNYSKGGRIMASKIKPKFDYYIVENSTKKLVSGYSTKGEAIEQRKLLVKEYPSMRFEIFTLGNLEKKTDLDVYAKKDYVELSTLDKIKKVSIDAYRYGQEKAGQAQAFLERNDVKGKIKRGARKVADKTKQGASWLQKQWREADFGDGTGRARFFADGGGVADSEIKEWENSMKKRNDIEFLRIEKTEVLPNNKLMVYYAYNPIGKDEFKGTQISTDVIKFADGGEVDFEKIKKADEIYREHNLERISKGLNDFSKESVDLWNEKYDDRLNKLNLTYEEKTQLNPKNWYANGGGVYFDKINKANEIYREHNLELKEKGIEEFTKESGELWDKGGYNERLKKLNLSYKEKTQLDPKKWYSDGGQVEIEINELYSKSNFINNHFNWQGKLLEMLQDNSVEAYNIYQSLTEKQKEEVLQELYEMDNDMGSYGDGDIETSRENLEILLGDAKNGNKYADGVSLDGELFKVHYLKVFEDGEQGDTVFVKEIYGKNENEAISKFKKIHGNYKIEYVGKYADGGGVTDSFLHLYKLTYPDGFYIVESYDGEYMSPKEAMEKMRINIKNFKSYKYKGVSSQNPKYKEWNERKDIGYSNTEAWDEVFENEKFADGGGVAQLPPKGELTNKDNLLLKYQKNGSEYEFYIYEPVTKNVSAYQQNKYLCKNKDCPIKMTYNQFINYLYTETYLDDLEYENGGGVDEKISYAIFSGDKMLSSVYLNNLGYTEKWVGYQDEDADKFGIKKIPAPKKIFVFRENSWLSFNSKEGAIEKIEYWKEDISKDSRYDDKIKKSLIKSAENLKQNIFPVKYAKGGGVGEYDIEILKKKYSEMNVSLHTKTGQVYVGGIKPNNKLYSDDKGYYLIDGYEKFMNKKYPIKKYFNHLENAVLSYYMNDKFEKGGESKGEYDVYDNKRMLLNQANEIEHHSEELIEQVNNTKKVPAWVIAKMERATTDLSDITHYLDGENKMANGGNVGEVKYEILPHINKFIIAKVTYKQQDDYIYPSKEFIYGFNDKFLEFNDIKSAQKFIDNIEPKYPYGIPKANAGMYLMASQFYNKQQQQPQVVYYIPQPQPQELENTGIIQNIPEMQSGGDVGYDDETINDFCITNLIELANELQSVRYYVTNRFKESDFESKTYRGRLTIVFKEPASINVINSLSKFLERAEDCHHIFEQSVNVSGSEPNGVSINLLSDKFSDIEFGKGGKVYDFPPKKINIAKTKKIKTQIGDFNLGLISKDFVYFINMEESDENGNTLMYDKNGELLSDNYFASNELYETLEKESAFDFIHPMMEIQRQEVLKEN